jgi:hypothetical protein
MLPYCGGLRSTEKLFSWDDSTTFDAGAKFSAAIYKLNCSKHWKTNSVWKIYANLSYNLMKE